jgi:hypothetical protein
VKSKTLRDKNNLKYLDDGHPENKTARIRNFKFTTLQILLLYHTSSNFKRAVVIRFTGHVDFVKIKKIDKYKGLMSHEMQLYQTTESMGKLHRNAFVRKLES